MFYHVPLFTDIFRSLLWPSYKNLNMYKQLHKTYN